MKMTFGKYVGTEIGELPQNYLEWLNGLKTINRKVRDELDKVFKQERSREENIHLIQSKLWEHKRKYRTFNVGRVLERIESLNDKNIHKLSCLSPSRIVSEMKNNLVEYLFS